jgi:signal transduction histidine kinase
MTAATATPDGSIRTPATGKRAAPATFEGRGRFAAYAAHELRAPIALQRALVEVALADPDADAAALRAMGERVVASCVRQQRLIEALLDLVLSGRGLTRREPVEIGAIVAAALRTHELGGLGSVVALEPAWTTGDPDLLERLVANLVSNAIRHNVAGGRVEVATHADAGRAVLSVANTGMPIPAGELQRLFQPFQRLAPQPTDAAGGVGLGLAIVRAIADAHAAFVTARARAGGGLEIHVGFPASAAA